MSKIKFVWSNIIKRHFEIPEDEPTILIYNNVGNCIIPSSELFYEKDIEYVLEMLRQGLYLVAIRDANSKFIPINFCESIEAAKALCDYIDETDPVKFSLGRKLKLLSDSNFGFGVQKIRRCDKIKYEEMLSNLLWWISVDMDAVHEGVKFEDEEDDIQKEPVIEKEKTDVCNNGESMLKTNDEPITTSVKKTNLLNRLKK